jgi:DNA-binding beta-propeller fold protein YncE
MNELAFDAFARSLTRRGLARGLTGLAAVTGVTQLLLNDAEAKKRKKKRKGKKRKKGNDGGGNTCNQTLCDGQCVDLDNDENNCGACGQACPADAVCVGGRCAVALGSTGAGEGEFSNPLALAISRFGNPLVVDSQNQRIVFLNEFSSFGEFGEEDGQFLFPVGLAVNPGSGDIYVTDIDRARIQRFDFDGNFDLGFGSFGSGDQQVNAPRGLAIDPRTNHVFVADTGNDRIKRLNENLFFLEDIGRSGSGDGEFDAPLGIAVDRDRNLVVADGGNNRIQIIDQDGNLIRAFGRPGSGNGEFDMPGSLAIAPNGNIFVIDRNNNRVQEFTSDGRFVKAFGRPGTAVGEFDAPFGIVFDEDVLIVSEIGNDRMQVFFPPGSEAAGRLLATAQGKTREHAQPRR